MGTPVVSTRAGLASLRLGAIVVSAFVFVLLFSSIPRRQLPVRDAENLLEDVYMSYLQRHVPKNPFVDGYDTFGFEAFQAALESVADAADELAEFAAAETRALPGISHRSARDAAAAYRGLASSVKTRIGKLMYSEPPVSCGADTVNVLRDIVLLRKRCDENSLLRQELDDRMCHTAASAYLINEISKCFRNEECDERILDFVDEYRALHFS